MKIGDTCLTSVGTDAQLYAYVLLCDMAPHSAIHLETRLVVEQQKRKSKSSLEKVLLSVSLYYIHIGLFWY